MRGKCRTQIKQISIELFFMIEKLPTRNSTFPKRTLFATLASSPSFSLPPYLILRCFLYNKLPSNYPKHMPRNIRTNAVPIYTKLLSRLTNPAAGPKKNFYPQPKFSLLPIATDVSFCHKIKIQFRQGSIDNITKTTLRDHQAAP